MQYSHQGIVWQVQLTHQETESLEGVLGTIAAAAGLANPGAAAAVGGAGAIILIVDAAGGDHGVNVTGVIGCPGVIVTPLASSLFQTLVQGAGVVVEGATIVDFLIRAGVSVPAVSEALGIPVVAAVFSAVAAGNPLGWAVAAGAGAVIKAFEPAPDPNQHGGIHADRTVVGPWERFIMTQIPPANHISLLSWQGLFSAQGGGGGNVYANRPKLGPWETWSLLKNGDGTVSFQTQNGRYLTATAGGGANSYCLSDRTAIGSWEKFYLVPQPGGHVAIKTHDKGTYLSVQQGT